MGRAAPVEEEEEAPVLKKAKTQKKDAPEAQRPGELLEVGAVVLYWDGWRGVVQDIFEALDSYWVADEESGEVVRDGGEIVAFKSAELTLVAPPPRCAQGNVHAPEVAVLLLGTAGHMTSVLEHFGPPDPKKRTEPQELLAIPCSLCDPASLLRTARDGVNPVTLKLAQEQRRDLHVALRVYHLKQAVEECVGMLRMEGFFCLAGVTVPFGEDEIKNSADKDERRWRRSVANQLDLCLTSYGKRESPDGSLVEAAQQALGKSCGVCLSDTFWDEGVQTRIRELLGATEVPLDFTDAMGAKVHVIVLPEDAECMSEDGIISFHESPNAPYTAPAAVPEGEAAEAKDSKPEAGGDPFADEEAPRKPAAEAAAEPAEAPGRPGDKTVADWEEKQREEFANETPLPRGWLRIKSRSSGAVYFFNKETQESSFDMPLPEGWSKQVSKSTGKTYYYHAGRNKSTFVLPTA